jgi:GMP synthase-like glutamine amidotransferase
MILIIDMCYEKDSLSNLEFVQPIKRIVESAREKTEVLHFSELNDEVIKNAKKIILCGTALKDNEFIYHKDDFAWLKDCKKPVLGICAGMQMIALAFGSIITQQKEIGMTQIVCKDAIFGDSMISAYELHGNGTSLPDGFSVIAENIKGVQAIKKDNIYGIVFHPEVRNRQLLLNFLKL